MRVERQESVHSAFSGWVTDTYFIPFLSQMKCVVVVTLASILKGRYFCHVFINY